VSLERSGARRILGTLLAVIIVALISHADPVFHLCHPIGVYDCHCGADINSRHLVELIGKALGSIMHKTKYIRPQIVTSHMQKASRSRKTKTWPGEKQ